MHLTFDLDFDFGAWPGPLGGNGAGARAAMANAPAAGAGSSRPASPRTRSSAAPSSSARFGEAWVGPQGLLTTLETALGLGGARASHLERVAALVPTVAATEGFWSRSAEADALATTEALLAWRDLLLLSGWTGAGESRRLRELAGVTSRAAPGLPDRIAALLATLASGRRADVASLRLLHPRTELPLLWRRVLAGLEQQGTAVTECSLAAPTATSDADLARAQHALARGAAFVPRGDGSLQLVRAAGPLQAAEDLAAHLAADPAPTTLIIGADAMLDAALARFGRPTVGATGPASENTLLQLLPLVLALGWQPPDPQRALELLTLRVTPFPRPLANALVVALHEVPAVGSSEWTEALGEQLAAVEDDARRDRIRARVASLLTPRIPRQSRYPTTEIAARAEALGQWLRTRAAMDEENPERWRAPADQLATFVRLVNLADVPAFTEAQLTRFVAEATAEAEGASPHPAQAGLSSLRQPGSVAGPAERVVWWGFTLEDAPGIGRLPFTRAERAELAELGVELLDPGAEAVARARRWRRPLEQATGSLLLVCPESGGAGEPQHPHPLWDEIVARIDDQHDPAPLVRSEPFAARPPRRSARTLLPLPAPRRTWRVAAGAIRPREHGESASSLGTMIGCPFSWVGRYAAALSGGQSSQLPRNAQLLGSFLHKVLELLAREDQTGTQRSPDEAAARAAQLFDELGPTRAAALFLPGADAERATARRAASESALALFRLLREHGKRVRAVEEPREVKALGTTLKGRIDLVLEPLAIVDLKAGSSTYRRAELVSGTAYQLAVYARLWQARDGRLPPVAYYMLGEQDLLTTDAAAFPTAAPIAGPSSAETWAATEKAFAIAWDRLAQGEVTATAVEDEDGGPPPHNALESGVLVLRPACDFCDFGALCGVSLESAGGAA